MRVLFINHAEEEILNENCEAYNDENIPNNMAKCKSLGKFLKENNFILKSIFSSNDLVCLKTAQIISEFFNDNGIEKFMNFDLRDYNQPKVNLEKNRENDIKEILDKFDFCEMNSPENFEQYLNKIEWLEFFEPDNDENNFRERVKKITFKFKELGQKEDYCDKCIAIITSKNFISQVFSWINNIESYLESKIFLSFKF